MPKISNPVKRGNKYDFNIYRVTFAGAFTNRNVLVLAKDIQSALSTIPQALSIEQLDGTIVVNKAVAKDIAKIVEKR